MVTVILLDRGRPDPTILTFKAKSTPLLQDTQEDKQASLGICTDAAPVLQILQVSNIIWLRVLSWLYLNSLYSTRAVDLYSVSAMAYSEVNIRSLKARFLGKVPQISLLFIHVYAAGYCCVIRYNIVLLLLQYNATAAGTLW